MFHFKQTDLLHSPQLQRLQAGTEEGGLGAGYVRADAARARRPV